MESISAKSILQKNKGTDWFGCNYNMNLYRGCSHGCIYCDSRSECYHIDSFDTVRKKEDCLRILRDELRRKVRSGIICTGSMNDPYNPHEREELLTRHALELINAFNFGVVSITKSDLITRDADVYAEIAEHSPVMCVMTVTTADDELCGKIEPYSSKSSERFAALKTLSDRGIFTVVTMMPLLPYLEDNEENVLEIVRRAGECGVKAIYPAFGVTLRGNQREYYYNKLDELFPDGNYRRKYSAEYGESYFCGVNNYRRLERVFKAECEKQGMIYSMQDIISAAKRGYEDIQLSFFNEGL